MTRLACFRAALFFCLSGKEDKVREQGANNADARPQRDSVSRIGIPPSLLFGWRYRVCVTAL
jgi:hypothetical protein